MNVVIAFDVDGTLECGNPPGLIKIETVKTGDRVAALRNGFSYIKPEDFTAMEDYY